MYLIVVPSLHDIARDYQRTVTSGPEVINRSLSPASSGMSASVAEVPDDHEIAIAVWVGVANPQSWGRGDCRGSGMVPLEGALVSS